MIRGALQVLRAARGSVVVGVGLCVGAVWFRVHAGGAYACQSGSMTGGLGACPGAGTRAGAVLYPNKVKTDAPPSRRYPQSVRARQRQACCTEGHFMVAGPSRVDEGIDSRPAAQPESATARTHATVRASVSISLSNSAQRT